MSAQQVADGVRNRQVVARAFLANIDRLLVIEDHVLMTMPVTHDGITAYYRLCTCGFISRPCLATPVADLIACPIQHAQSIRLSLARTNHAVDVIKTLAEPSHGVTS